MSKKEKAMKTQKEAEVMQIATLSDSLFRQ